MDSFSINREISVDLKIKSRNSDYDWYMINIEHMMLMRSTENANPVNNSDKFYPGIVHPMRLTDEGLHYFDQQLCTWHLLEEVVQREFSDYIAEKELLGK